MLKINNLHGIVDDGQKPILTRLSLEAPNGVKNNGDTEVDAKYDAPVGEWV